ncbi:MAG: hypothetical protein DYG93_00860 [Leptolyngbya sp. PLA2]|nr:hypothetical protein [Leptolyngbya sp. PL-A2]MCQ3941400.1 hypothetical protein [cyanobacterium CYA1]
MRFPMNLSASAISPLSRVVSLRFASSASLAIAATSSSTPSISSKTALIASCTHSSSLSSRSDALLPQASGPCDCRWPQA